MLSRDVPISSTKISALQYAMRVVFLMLGSRLWNRQVVSSENDEAQAEHNRVREVPILAPRGKIKDREGRLIVDNRPSFSALLLRDQTKDLSLDLPKISAGLNLPPTTSWNSGVAWCPRVVTGCFAAALPGCRGPDWLAPAIACGKVAVTVPSSPTRTLTASAGMRMPSKRQPFTVRNDPSGARENSPSRVNAWRP